MASSSNAASGPTMRSTWSRSISSCAFVLAPAGLPPVSAMISSAVRPASLLPRCLRNSEIPCSIWMPPCASGPVLTVNSPILTGFAWPNAGNGRLAASAAAALPVNIPRRPVVSVIFQPSPSAMAYPVVGHASVEWYLSAEHGEDQLPIPVRRAFVMDVAIGQRIAMLRARVEFVAIRDRAAAQKVAEFLDHCRRRMGIVFRKAAIKFAPKPLREPMRGIVAIGNQRRAVQAGTGD